MREAIFNELTKMDWAMAPGTFPGFLHSILSASKGAASTVKAPKPLSYVSYYTPMGTPIAMEPNGSTGPSIMLMDISGPMFKHDYPFFGIIGTSTLARTLKKADENPNVLAHVLRIDSPGGRVDGTEHFANVVKSAKKPVVAFVDGTMASAAMWVGSAADKRILSGKTAMAGSIGTMIEAMDFTEMLKNWGIKVHTVNADDSPEKNKDYYDMMAGKYGPIKKNYLNPVNEVFMSTIKQNLPNVKDAALHGAMYVGDQAISMGLANGMGSLQDAIVQAAALAAAEDDDDETVMDEDEKLETEEEEEEETAMDEDEKLETEEEEEEETKAAVKPSAWADLAALFGKKGSDPAAKKKFEEIKAMGAQMAAMAQERDAALAAKKTLAKGFKAQAKQIAALNAEVAKLSKKNAASAARVDTSSDPPSGVRLQAIPKLPSEKRLEAMGIKIEPGFQRITK